MVNSIYYNPASLYGMPRHYSQETWGDAYWRGIHGPQGLAEQNPQASYLRFIAPWASGNDQFSRWVQGEFNRVYGGYGAASLTNPDLLWQDYLTQNLGQQQFQQNYGQLHPGERGVRAPNYGGGRAQWIVY